MATIIATQAGPYSASATWGGVSAPAGNNIADANGYAISVDQNISCTAIQNTTGGGFTVPTGTQNRTIAAVVANASSATCLTLSHTAGTVAIDGNVTAGAGVGVVKNSTGTLTLSGRTIAGGTAANTYGLQSTQGVVTITDCNLIGGSAANATGFHHNNSTTPGSTITGGTIKGTVSAVAAHGLLVSGSNGKSLTLTNVAIVGGSAAAAHGIRCTGDTNALVISTGCTITGGSFAVACGVTNEGASTLPVTGCTITGGGGALSHGLYNASTGAMTLTGCTLINTVFASAVVGKMLFLPGAANYIEYPYAAAPSVYYYAKTIIAGNVLSGVNGDGSTVPATGTYHAPEAYEVVSDAVFGPLSAIQGNVTNPLEVFVLNGIDYGAYGTQYHGALTLPAEAQVLKNISYGQGSGLTGQLEPGGGALVGPSALISG
jgi:hypothetical protein